MKILIALLATFFLAPVSTLASDITGEWDVKLYATNGDQVGKSSLTLKQDGEKLTGVYTDGSVKQPITGTLKNSSILINSDRDRVPTIPGFWGKLDPDNRSIAGNIFYRDGDSKQAGYYFTAEIKGKSSDFFGSDVNGEWVVTIRVKYDGGLVRPSTIILKQNGGKLNGTYDYTYDDSINRIVNQNIITGTIVGNQIQFGFVSSDKQGSMWFIGTFSPNKKTIAGCIEIDEPHSVVNTSGEFGALYTFAAAKRDK